MSKLLIQESPLQVLPSLACKIGLSPALLLQQIHYLLSSSPILIQDETQTKWMKLSWAEWREKYFPFWQLSTLRKNMEFLKKQGLVRIKTEFLDQKNAYTIDYNKLHELEIQNTLPNLPPLPCQNQQGATEKEQTHAENQHPSTTVLDTKLITKNINKDLTKKYIYIYNNSSKKRMELYTRAEKTNMNESTNKQKQKGWTPGRIELYRLLFAFKEACGDSLGLGHLIKEEGLPECIPGRLKSVIEDIWRDWLKKYAEEHHIGLKELKRHLVELGHYMRKRKPLQLKDKNIALEEFLLRPSWQSLWMQEALSHEPIAPCPPKIQMEDISVQDEYPDQNLFNQIISKFWEQNHHMH